MSKFEIEIDEETLKKYLEFCSEVNMDSNDLIVTIINAIVSGGGTILKIPFHAPNEVFASLMEEYEEISEDDDSDDKDDKMDSLMNKYLS